MAIAAWVMPVAASAALWVVWSLLIGGVANRLPDRLLQTHGEPRRPPGADAAGGSAEGDGLRIHSWKRWIPDAGAALPGGVRKATLVRRDPRALRRLMVETRRAELVHWALWPAWILTALWLPPPGVLVNLAFATFFNLPCLLLQRYNRRRLERILWRMAVEGRP